MQLAELVSKCSINQSLYTIPAKPQKKPNSKGNNDFKRKQVTREISRSILRHFCCLHFDQPQMGLNCARADRLALSAAAHMILHIYFL